MSGIQTRNISCIGPPLAETDIGSPVLGDHNTGIPAGIKNYSSIVI